jgi:hypothetical protein
MIYGCTSETFVAVASKVGHLPETFALVNEYQVAAQSAVTITNPLSFQGELMLGVTGLVLLRF